MIFCREEYDDKKADKLFTKMDKIEKKVIPLLKQLYEVGQDFLDLYEDEKGNESKQVIKNIKDYNDKLWGAMKMIKDFTPESGW